MTEEVKETIEIGEPFYYPYTGKWYQYTDYRREGKLSCRVCKELKDKAESGETRLVVNKRRENEIP